MLLSNRMDNVKTVINLVRNYFKENVIGFEILNHENEEDFNVECILYRSFRVSVGVADISKGGVFNISVDVGGKLVGLYLVSENRESLSLSFTEKSVNANLDILNKYLIWRMTDEQKQTFGLL